MEDGLEALCLTASSIRQRSLNPCFSGRWSRRGTYTLVGAECRLVLILVLVEDGLEVLYGCRWSSCGILVLILVLVEDGLEDKRE